MNPVEMIEMTVADRIKINSLFDSMKLENERSSSDLLIVSDVNKSETE